MGRNGVSRIHTVTEKDTSAPGTYWRYLSNDTSAFNPIVFDERQLAEQNLISGLSGAGRGNTYFVNLKGQLLVLRHYRRGGMAQKISAGRYLYTGLSRTRAMLEFDILQQMHDMQLPVPKPYACRVALHGMTYEASIVTHRLPGSTLAQLLISASVSDEQWSNIGSTIARFHAKGICHADLNAHNIILSGDGCVSLIDFDRARVRALSANPGSEKWCLSNLNRLRRSLHKIALNGTPEAVKTPLEKLSASEPLESVDTAAIVSTEELRRGFDLLRSSWKHAVG